MIVLFLLVLASVIFCYSVAKKRGSDRTYWTILAILIGPIAVPFVLFSKPKAGNNSE